MFDAIIHVGDFAYDMYENNGERGDLFMEQIEPIASTVPYMTCPGNLFYFMEVYRTYDLSCLCVSWLVGRFVSISLEGKEYRRTNKTNEK